MNNKQKEMLKLFRKLLTKISKINLGALCVYPEFKFQPDDSHFLVTVFGRNSENCTVYFYHFTDIRTLEEKADRLVEAIKSDDLSKVKAVAL